MKLEKMEEFFDNRLEDYEEHQLYCIESAKEFYSLYGRAITNISRRQVLDLGCGTGLDLNEYFKRNPSATVRASTWQLVRWPLALGHSCATLPLSIPLMAVHFGCFLRAA